MEQGRLDLIRVITGAVVAIVLIVAMTWIVVSPASDAISKAALMVISTAVGFIFGRETAK
jgi:hypothetical protein